MLLNHPNALFTLGRRAAMATGNSVTDVDGWCAVSTATDFLSYPSLGHQPGSGERQEVRRMCRIGIPVGRDFTAPSIYQFPMRRRLRGKTSARKLNKTLTAAVRPEYICAPESRFGVHGDQRSHVLDARRAESGLERHLE
jgi:hypothetical protein